MTPEQPELLTIIADSPRDAFHRIREKLGPDAVVLSVRALPRTGLSKLWQRSRVEVRARARSKPAGEDGTLAHLLETIRRLNQQLPDGAAHALAMDVACGARFARGTSAGVSAPCQPLSDGVEEWIAFGLLPEHAHSLAEPGLDGRDRLVRSWRETAPTSSRVHLLVGTPGSGKTTALCKWLAQVVLLGGKTARVWRLDGRSANTAESLSIYAEILSVPIERAWSQPPAEMEIGFIDVPGVDWRDAGAVREVTGRIAAWGDVQVHLVLNAAYETSLLLEQAAALRPLRPADLIVTHLDEEPRWGKLWNLVLGTPWPLRFLGVGQNVPGTFQVAAPRHLL